DIVNNFSKISFNFGPILLSWLEKHNAEVYAAILEADKKSQEVFSGHGSALAQAYNHIIMPLANRQDKQTQVIWGIRDFEHRFKRRPEGMWLPETAVDVETLEILAEQEIRFTILAPRQAQQVKSIEKNEWHTVEGSKIDPKQPYLCCLPSGRHIVIFFYDGPIAQELAFSNLLENGEHFARRLTSAFNHDDNAPQLVHIATDGETYGHHHRYGDMALAYALYFIELNNLARLTVYGEYLEKYPPDQEIKIFENSSWSCIHGIERWQKDCGCNSGMHSEWNQQWRAPLRGAMDWLKDNLIPIYEEFLEPIVRDPWKLRDNYIALILDRSSENIDRFLQEHAKQPLSHEEKIRILKLLEMQRHAMLMYTSCGWFFDEISGIETVQILCYAARALQLAEELSQISLEEVYQSLLEKAPSNLKNFEHGGKVYELLVKPAVLDLLRAGVHYVVSSLFRDYPESINIYTYQTQRQFFEKMEVGKQKLAIGKSFLQSSITREEYAISFAALHLGDQNLISGAREFMGNEAFSGMHREIKESFSKGEISEVILLIDKHFKNHSYSLWHLFRDEQREIFNQLFTLTLKDVESSFRQLYENHYPMMQAVEGLNITLPRYFKGILDFVIDLDINREIETEEPDGERLQKLVEEVKRWSLEIDVCRLSLIVSQKVNASMEKLATSPHQIELLGSLINLLKIVNLLDLTLNLWKAQNVYFIIGKNMLEAMSRKAQQGQNEAKQWIEAFSILGGYLNVRIF
ncbi:MAG TPA: glycoside hydrolase, partial [Candidatus Atribacteria bacterium]|nr:glycoside hydrolase [Candidatus Atribacteria bacterium]